MSQDEKILEAVNEMVRLGKLVAPKMAELAKAMYDEGIKAGLAPAQAWELTMHGVRNTNATV